MENEKSGDFFEQFDENKLSKMIKEAWKTVDNESQKKYGKKIEDIKLGKEKAQSIASKILDNFQIKKNEPTRIEYRADIEKALTTGDRGEQETDDKKTAWQEIGYS
jgi:hypothetical protein